MSGVPVNSCTASAGVCRGGGGRQLTCELAPRAGVVLQVVRFVEHERRPRHAQEVVECRPRMS